MRQWLWESNNIVKDLQLARFACSSSSRFSHAVSKLLKPSFIVHVCSNPIGWLLADIDRWLTALARCLSVLLAFIAAAPDDMRSRFAFAWISYCRCSIPLIRITPPTVPAGPNPLRGPLKSVDAGDTVREINKRLSGTFFYT